MNRPGLLRTGTPIVCERKLELTPNGCPRLRVPGGLLSLNGEIALGYLELGYRPIPLIQDQEGKWVPAAPWKPFQHQAPTRQQIAEWWMRYSNAGIALVCGTVGLIPNFQPRPAPHLETASTTILLPQLPPPI